MNEFSSVLPYALISLLGVFLSSVSQVMLKKAAMRKYDSVLKEYLNPLVIFAYAIFFSTTQLGVLAYKGMPVSLGPVLETTAYFYITIFGGTIFKEKLNPKDLLALALIIGGIMPLLPGLSMTNAIRDTINGDLVSGSARALEALLACVAIAAGVGVVLSL